MRATSQELMRRHAYIINFPGGAHRIGVPDYLACVYGWFVAIELKKKGQHPRRRQAHELLRIERAGGVAFSADNIVDIRKVLDELATRKRV